MGLFDVAFVPFYSSKKEPKKDTPASLACGALAFRCEKGIVKTGLRSDSLQFLFFSQLQTHSDLNGDLSGCPAGSVNCLNLLT